METDQFTFLSDPGHGWLIVDWTHLKRLNLNPADFSRCSMRKGNTFYLEEDCDAPKFLAAYKAKHGDPRIRELSVDGDAPCRRFERIGPQIVANELAVGFALQGA